MPLGSTLADKLTPDLGLELTLELALEVLSWLELALEVLSWPELALQVLSWLEPVCSQQVCRVLLGGYANQLSKGSQAHWLLAVSLAYFDVERVAWFGFPLAHRLDECKSSQAHWLLAVSLAYFDFERVAWFGFLLTHGTG